MKNEELGDILFNFGDEFDLGSSPHIAGGSGGQGGCGGSGGGGGSGGNALTDQTSLDNN